MAKSMEYRVVIIDDDVQDSILIKDEIEHVYMDDKCETLCYVADMTKRSGYPLK